VPNIANIVRNTPQTKLPAIKFIAAKIIVKAVEISDMIGKNLMAVYISSIIICTVVIN
jgi:hypothetical protein